ncbi:MAG: hypothetical protein ABJP45_15110 [Cyclobacteriaceae bacterium]
MDDKNTTLLMGMIAKIAADNSFNKALNIVLLKELSMLTESDYSSLIRSAKALQSENLNTTHEVFNDLISQTYDGATPGHLQDFPQ